MNHLIDNIAGILILLFLIITFLQSGFDKISDWSGNLSWLNEHFSKTFLKSMVPVMLGTVMVIEMVAGILCVMGVYSLVVDGDRMLGLYGTVLACLALLMLLFGQRIAKDYAGAMTITCYFMVAVFGVYLLGK